MTRKIATFQNQYVASLATERRYHETNRGAEFFRQLGETSPNAAQQFLCLIVTDFLGCNVAEQLLFIAPADYDLTVRMLEKLCRNVIKGSIRILKASYRAFMGELGYPDDAWQVRRFHKRSRKIGLVPRIPWMVPKARPLGSKTPEVIPEHHDYIQRAIKAQILELQNRIKAMEHFNEPRYLGYISLVEEFLVPGSSLWRDSTSLQYERVFTKTLLETSGSEAKQQIDLQLSRHGVGADRVLFSLPLEFEARRLAAMREA